MAKREKRLKKQIAGLLKQAEKHEEKIKAEKGKKDTTLLYWETEKKRYEKQTKQKEEMLEKLKNKK